eukprot:5134428-Amphidinium_carterae.1
MALVRKTSSVVQHPACMRYFCEVVIDWGTCFLHLPVGVASLITFVSVVVLLNGRNRLLSQ